MPHVAFSVGCQDLSSSGSCSGPFLSKAELGPEGRAEPKSPVVVISGGVCERKGDAFHEVSAN